MDRAVVCIDPATGSVTPFARFDAPVAGLAVLGDGLPPALPAAHDDRRWPLIACRAALTLAGDAR